MDQFIPYSTMPMLVGLQIINEVIYHNLLEVLLFAKNKISR
jgi:hypothetical protein